MSRPDDVTAADAADHDPKPRSARRRFGSSTHIGVAAVVVIGIVAGLLAWFFIVRTDDDETSVAPTAPATTVPEIASVADLTALADSGETFYWAGVRSGTRIELTAPDGTVYIRYLPPDEPAGSTAPALTVATYPRSNAFDEVSSAAEAENATKLDLPRGGIAAVDDTTGTNVHLAYPDRPFQVEVYAPRPGLAQSLVANGTIRAFS